ncbi:hypothetical protein E0Z10_g9185 [Xylaria hypoxylon]|uniref:Glutamyl-tRNA synthetase n=1 Tax=Xylaria hypoxylon TaxID=37992 RepID=A0A4Z0YPR3_9PEZI|nr:hypothetical protein E0Z10_g9185 [Xylaria hypoxylon]
MTALSDLPVSFAAARKAIDDSHAEDPKTAPSADGSDKKVPNELHYARKMSRWLAVRSPDASPTLQLACRAQHFRRLFPSKKVHVQLVYESSSLINLTRGKRWEIPRDSFPMTRTGYLTWRAKQKTQAAEKITTLLSSIPSSSSAAAAALSAEDIDRVAALVRKENLSADTETQVLEDVACLVFLDDQLDDFGKRDDVDEDKMVNILRKTWAKMSPRGREIALDMRLSERAKTLVGKALAG